MNDNRCGFFSSLQQDGVLLLESPIKVAISAVPIKILGSLSFFPSSMTPCLDMNMEKVFRSLLYRSKVSSLEGFWLSVEFCKAIAFLLSFVACWICLQQGSRVMFT